MKARRYAQVRYPWRAVVDTRSPHPGRFYAALVGQALRYGLPGARRPARAWAFAGRVGIPETTLARCLRATARHPRPDLDGVLDQLEDAWPRLAARSDRLGARPLELTTLVLERRAARTIFVFGEGASPLLVLKEPPSGGRRVDVEAAALQEAEAAGVAPRHLGSLGRAQVQEVSPARRWTSSR